MAIGTSPCPPFSNRSGLPPGVIWDGNTIAWYKYNDTRTYAYDGGGRVANWLDRYNYLESAELVNQLQWFTPAYWNTFNPNWSQVGNTLVSNGNNGFLQKNNFFVIGTTYRLRLTVIRNAGQLNATDGVFTYAQINLSGSYTFLFTATAVNMVFSSVLFNGSITAMSVISIAGNHLVQQTAANEPTWNVNGIIFDGANDFMVTHAIPGLVQPTIIYWCGRQVTWTINDRFFDGVGVTSGIVSQSAVSPEIRAAANLASPVNGNLPVNTFGIVTVYFNGVNSFLRVNRTAPVNWNCGVLNMLGFCLGSGAGGAANWANIQNKEIIIRTNIAGQDDIYNYIRNSNGI